VAPSPSGRSKLDFALDVDWSDEALAASAKAAGVISARARAAAVSATDAELAAQRSARASAGRNLDPARRSSERASAVDVTVGDRTSRHRLRKQQARRARMAGSPMFLFAFVSTVIIALVGGFVGGFLVGRERPRAEAGIPRGGELPRAEAESDSAVGASRVAAVKTRVESATPQPPDSGEAVTPPPAPAAPVAQKATRGPFDAKVAGAALGKAAGRAGTCVQPGDAGGDAVVTVTFDPATGAARNAGVYGARFTGTQAGECIAALLRDVKVRPFIGEPVTVKKTIQVQ
jgi:hypothetical protein